MAVLTLADAKAHLNITTTTHDAELTSLISSAEAAIAQRVGPLEPTDVTSRVSGRVALILPVYPVLSLTSIKTSSGFTLPVTDYTINLATGEVVHISGLAFTASPYYTVAYKAGRAAGALPADILLADKELVRHLWESQRGASRAAVSPMGESAAAPGYLLPYRVQELLAPHMQFGLA